MTGAASLPLDSVTAIRFEFRLQSQTGRFAGSPVFFDAADGVSHMGELGAAACTASGATPPPPAVTPPPPPAPRDCLADFLAMQEDMFTGCCDDGCPAGAPTSCSAACDAVIRPYADACGDWARNDPTLADLVALIGICSAPAPAPAPDCLQMISDRADQMNVACCADAADCATGAPTTCGTTCADVLQPYFEVCSGFASSDPDFSPILQPLIGMCEDSKFGVFTGSLFSRRCSTAEKRQFLSTTLPAACCGVNQANCPGGASLPPLPTSCTPQCAGVFEHFCSECHPAFDATADAAAFDSFLVQCQAQPPPGGH